MSVIAALGIFGAGAIGFVLVRGFKRRGKSSQTKKATTAATFEIMRAISSGLTLAPIIAGCTTSVDINQSLSLPQKNHVRS